MHCEQEPDAPHLGAPASRRCVGLFETMELAGETPALPGRLKPGLQSKILSGSLFSNAIQVFGGADEEFALGSCNR